MTTVLAMNAKEVITRGVSSVQDIPLSRIQESKTNPRRQFDETKLDELADNIRLHGVLQPVLVRPLPGDEPDSYELVAGARRYRASRLAKMETIPASVRELTDTQCLELQLVENLQRADVHELDEARGYAALMQLQPETYTVETMAEKIGRSEKYVYARLRLTHLIEEVQQAFYSGKLSVAHAFEMAQSGKPALLPWLVKWKKVAPPKTVQRQQPHFTVAQMAAIVNTAKNQMSRALFALAAGTGARAGELFALRVENDVDLNEQTLTIRRSVLREKKTPQRPIRETKIEPGLCRLTLP